MSTSPPPIMSPVWTTRTKRIVAILTLLLVGLVVLRFSELLPMVAVAVILAYLLTPLVMFIEKRVLTFGPFARRPHRGLAVLLAYLVVIAVFVIVILVVVPIIINQFEEFGRRFPQLLRGLGNTLERILNEPLTFGGEPILINGEPLVPLEQLRDITNTPPGEDVIRLQDLNLVEATQTFIAGLTAPAFSFVGSALTAIINIIFLLALMFYLLRDGLIFIEKGIEITPPSYRNDVRRVLYELAQVWNAYLRGQLTLALIMGVTVFVVATFIGLPTPPILGIISALLEFIPSIGPGLAIFPAALLALSSQSTTLPFLEGEAFMIVVIIIWAAMHNIEAFILVPRIMGGSLNLHPVVVIVAVLAGANLAGVLGIILAAPAVASLRVFGQYIYGKLLDRDPFPVPRHRGDRRTRYRVQLRRLWQPVMARVSVLRLRLEEQLRSRQKTARKEDHV